MRKEVPGLFLQREEIIRQALEAHEEGQYALSIPTRLSQMEGMFFAVPESHYYSQDDREEGRKELGGQDPDATYTALFGYHLFQSGSLHEDYGANPREVARKKDSWFNRNIILHGHSTDYHTVANSIRALIIVGLTCKYPESSEKKR